MYAQLRLSSAERERIGTRIMAEAYGDTNTCAAQCRDGGKPGRRGARRDPEPHEGFASDPSAHCELPQPADARGARVGGALGTDVASIRHPRGVGTRAEAGIHI